LGEWKPLPTWVGEERDEGRHGWGKRGPQEIFCGGAATSLYYARVFGVGGSNGAICGSLKSKMAAGGHLGYTKMAVTAHLSPRYIGTGARRCAEMIIRSHLVTAQMAAKMRATAVA